MLILWSLLFAPKYPKDVCGQIGHAWDCEPDAPLPDSLSKKEWHTWECRRCKQVRWIHIKVLESFCDKGGLPVNRLLDKLANSRPQFEERLKWSQ